jgi:hypothetical protein
MTTLTKSQSIDKSEQTARFYMDNCPLSLQENLLVLLYHYPKAGKKVADRIDPTLFEGDYRVFAERVIEFWKSQGKPPGIAHSADDIIKEKQNRRATTYRRILFSLEQLKGKANRKFIFAQLDEFTQDQEMKRGVLKAAQLLNARQRGLAKEAMRAAIDGAPSARILTTQPFDQIEERPVRWLFKPFIRVVS